MGLEEDEFNHDEYLSLGRGSLLEDKRETAKSNNLGSNTLLGALNGLGKVERFVRVTLRVEFDAHAGEIRYSLFKI